ncbi:MAG: type I 3-dehydroquinate dehydratase [Treponema sp.]|jgi:3-dehydroquinate dehydratase/shikimate dehydrogenase|nr:type I 3-dehydroquinate dehydratase [Treponema sp.]
MAKICLCLTGKTLERDLQILKKYRRYIDMVELRVDCLTPDERFFIRKFPEMAGLPSILTIRRNIDGGMFSEGEWSRIGLLSRGLAFAEADRRHNFAYIDLEDDLDIPGIEEAARTFGTRIIRSYHNINGLGVNLVDKIQRMRRVGDEIVKLAVTPHSLEEVHAVMMASRQTMDIDKILICMGDFGLCSRILADKFGSQITFTSVKGEHGMPKAAPGQFDPVTLVDFYRFRSIDENTRVFGITGYPLKTTFSPAFFNAVFNLEKTNAVYMAFPSVSAVSFIQFARDLGLSGASVTIPHKEAIVSFLAEKSPTVRSVGACNTIVRNEDDTWKGFNTDMQGFSDSLLHFIGKKNFSGRKISIIGAGGVARAIAAEIFHLKGKALVLNRTLLRARELAESFGFRWGGLDTAGIALIDKYNDIIIQTTSVGMEPGANADPLDLYKFSGKEVVMDVIYKPAETALLRRASSAGCRTLNGYDMFVRQAQAQYKLFMGKEVPADLMSRIEL